MMQGAPSMAPDYYEAFANDLRGDFVTPRQLQLIRYVRQEEGFHYLNAGLLDAVRAEIEMSEATNCESTADNWTIVSVSKAFDIGRVTIDTHAPLASTMQYTLVKHSRSWYVVGIKRTEFRGAG